MTARPSHPPRIWLRRSIAAGALLLITAGVVSLALVSIPAAGSRATFSAAHAVRCAPATLNASAVLPGTGVAVSPMPGSYAASPETQISLLGAPIGALQDVRVRGSRTGVHPGRLRPYSQGDGASFLPDRPFRAGEQVTVRGAVREGARSVRFDYGFVVAHEDPLPHTSPIVHVRDPQEKQHFHSEPSLQPPVVVVNARSSQTAPGDIFTAPYSGPGASGPMIFDEAGNLVWFHPVSAATASTNLQVQQLGGKPVLTWWQGYVPPQGFGQGEEMIYSSSYRQIGRVHAGNGYKADLHDFHITPQGTAVLTVFNPIDCDLASVGGSPTAAVTDTIFQEVDLATGLVRREWHSIDHVPIAESYAVGTGSSTTWPFDYFHLNSVDQLADGRTLVSARNTSAMYELSTLTGQVLTHIGGRHSSVKLSAGAATAYQHDATVQPNGTISVFDNGAVPRVHAQSRAVLLAVDPQQRTDTLLAQFDHPKPLSSGSQGSVQLLPNGDVFVGWGSEPYFSEYNAQGELLFDAHWHGTYQSYRAYRFPWIGAPDSPPAIAAVAGSGGAPPTVYASWNGDNRTVTWRLLAGASTQALAPVASAARNGFETAIAAPAHERYVAVQALDASGAVLGTSRTISG